MVATAPSTPSATGRAPSRFLSGDDLKHASGPILPTSTVHGAVGRQRLKKMVDIVLLLLIFCGGLASGVRAFPSHRRLGKLPLLADRYPGFGVPPRTKYLQLSGSFEDMISAAAATLSAMVAVQPFAENFRKRLETKLPTAKVEFPILASYQYYVNRTLLEERILQVYEARLEDRLGGYTIIVGSKGTGKSFATAHVLNNQPRVLYLKVNQADTESSLLHRLLKDCGVPIKGSIDVGLDAIIPSLLQVAKVGDGLMVTIVLEVERGSSSDGLLKMLQSTAKELALAANVIIILSEANAGLAFGDDPRQNFIWVDGMTDVEATVFAKKVFPAVIDHDLESFFEKVGIISYSCCLYVVQINLQVTRYAI